MNPSKFKAYFGGFDEQIRKHIQDITTFEEWSLPFRYLVVVLTSKKVTINTA